ncbi:MAG: tetratricopeptide repeat protein, partial [Proteobacteria bacterium]|nr:tetratricopeptide repeat protein [Pseudomonadota bacterium]
MGRTTLGRYTLLLTFLLLSSLAACANTARLKEQAVNHINIGSAYLGSGQYNSAMKEFLEAERLTPEDPKVHFLLGIAYHGRGLDERAIGAFQRAIDLNPDDPAVHNFLGAIYLGMGRVDDAIASFNRALRNVLYETPATALYNLGRAYYEKGQYDTALKQYRDAIAREPDTILMPLIEKDIGRVWLAKGDPDEAIRHFLKSIELAPSLAESHYWLGVCYQKKNKSGDAAAAFQATV